MAAMNRNTGSKLLVSDAVDSLAHNAIAAELPFIVSVGQAKVDPTTRKFIRSHVMRGKNRVKMPKRKSKPADKSLPEATSSLSDELIRAEPISRWMSPKFSGIRFADEIEPALVEDVLSLLVISSKAMFLLDQCIIPNEDGVVQAWFKPMLSDPAYVHVASLTTQAFFDNFLGRTRNAEALRREYTSFAKSIQLLSKRLAINDKITLLSHSNLMTVLLLSGYSYTRGDHKAAHQHNVALIKLVKLKGVHEFLRDSNTKLVNEVIRTDFCICYENGQKPVLFTDEDIPWPLILPQNHTRAKKDSDSIESRLDPDLSTVWTAMSHFCALMDVASSNPAARVTEETFLHVMGSILYRILHMRFEENTHDEYIRLGLLAFASPVFLDWKTVYWLNGHFTRIWRQALNDILMESTLTPRDRIWLLMTGTLSMSHDSNLYARLISGLQALVEQCNILTWNDMRQLLASYMWIGTLFDKEGKDVFDAILAHTGKGLSLSRRYNGRTEYWNSWTPDRTQRTFRLAVEVENTCFISRRSLHAADEGSRDAPDVPTIRFAERICSPPIVLGHQIR